MLKSPVIYWLPARQVGHMCLRTSKPPPVKRAGGETQLPVSAPIGRFD